MSVKKLLKEMQTISERIVKEDPLCDTYLTLLTRHAMLANAIRDEMDAEERVRYDEECQRLDAADDPVEDDPEDDVPEIEEAPEEAPPEKPKREKPKKEKPTPELETEPEETEDEEEPMKLADVRKVLAEAAADGIDVTAIINEAGYVKLSEIPPKEYRNLLKALDERRAES